MLRIYIKKKENDGVFQPRVRLVNNYVKIQW